MTEEERYLFDLQGYLVLRRVLPAVMVCQLNAEIDELESLADEEAAARGVARRHTTGSIYAKVGAQPEKGSGDYTCDILKAGGAFEELIDWPGTLPYIEEMIGEPCRLDAATFMARHGGGGFKFHHGYAELLPYSEYSFENGQFKCVSVKISYALSDVGVEDGCFAVIPGSHKSNYLNPLVGQIPDPNHPLVQALPAEAGDAILFSEDLSHGAVENRGCRVRRTLFYSYAPAFHAAWGRMADVAEGFERRANPRRIALAKGPSPFAHRGASQVSVR